ncbi:MAG: hypothetical protein EA426_13855 [Spirochaetaceae bacterium]|nr:MAG: hypothetical protein EA426_13855 [Spirochaetaceae bacterium]
MPSRRYGAGAIALLAVLLVITIAACDGDARRRSNPERPEQSHDSSSSPDVAAEPAETVSPLRARAVELVDRMTLDEKAAQVLITTIGGGREVTDEFRARLSEIPVGGVILLGYNIGPDAEAVMALTRDLQRHAREVGAGLPLFIAVDHEGGTVFRFGEIMTRLPSASVIGPYIAHDEARPLVEELFVNTSHQLAALGFSMNFAPILEPLAGENEAFLRFRAYSADPDVAAAAAGLFVDAMRDAGVVAVGKHFPGSGDGDPHDVLPVFGLESSSADADGVRAFSLAVRTGAVPAIMTAHVMAPTIDPDQPATLSHTVQSEFLRGEVGFDGLIVTDDLNMRGLRVSLPADAAAPAALRAGADMLLYMADDLPAVHEAIVRAVADGELPEARLDDAVIRIVETKLEYALPEITSDEAMIERGAAFDRLKARGDGLLTEFTTLRTR